MAAVDWPWDLCTVIVDGYGLDDANNVRRTPMQDGAIEQKRITSFPFKVREFEVIVKQSNVKAFRAWVRANGFQWFNFRDVDDDPADNIIPECRIVGGTIALRRMSRQEETLDGEAVWRGTAELEGFVS